MYGDILGASTLPAGIVLLPNTGGNPILLGVALLSTAIGSIVVASTVVRIVAKRLYK